MSEIQDILTEYHLDHWTDDDFIQHIPAVRKTIFACHLYRLRIKELEEESLDRLKTITRLECELSDAHYEMIERANYD